jgi:formate hydrogenlyase transcriptional activator
MGLNALSLVPIHQKDSLFMSDPPSCVNTEEKFCSEPGFEGIVGRSEALLQVLQLIEMVATTDSTVLLVGETGTGKELIARAIHRRSRRRERALVRLSCAAIPSGLLESELFGHERGAFTGAIAQKIGWLELADQGTLFLDEIGDLPLELQPKLLRVLQEREFERLGSTRTKRVDARLVAATNRDLEGMVAEKQFRADLYYRLNVFPVEVPPLRERSEDIPLLVHHFAQHYAWQMKKTIETIPSETIQALTRYSWPGNIRELQNLIERAVILSSGTVLRVPLGNLGTRTIPAQERGKRQTLEHAERAHILTLPAQEGREQQTLEQAERAHILAAVKESKWVLSGPKGAAARLGINRSTLQFRMKKLGIARPWHCNCQA